MILAVLIGLLVAELAALVWLLRVIRKDNAPDGQEDSTGFHLN